MANKIKTSMDLSDLDVDHATGIASKQLTKLDVAEMMQIAENKINIKSQQLETLSNQRAELVSQIDALKAQLASLKQVNAPDA